MRVKLKSFICISLFLILCLSCSVPSYISVDVLKPAAIHLPGVKIIAVADFQGPKRAGSQVATLLQSYLLETQHYDIMERDKLKGILDEQNLGMAGVVDEATAAEVGSLLGVDALVFGEVTAYEIERDERGTEKVKRQVGTGKYEWVEQKNIFTGKKKKVKKEIMKTDWIGQHYKIRRGTVAINFRVVRVGTGQLASVHSDSKSYTSGKVIDGSNQTLKPKGQILSDLSKQICKKFSQMIAPYHVTEQWYIESGDGKIKEGKTLAEAGLWPEAMEAWYIAVRSNPEIPAGYYNLGLGFEVRGDLNNAEKYYKQALGMKQNKRYMDAIARVREAKEDQKKLQEQLNEE